MNHANRGSPAGAAVSTRSTTAWLTEAVPQRTDGPIKQVRVPEAASDAPARLSRDAGEPGQVAAAMRRR